MIRLIPLLFAGCLIAIAAGPSAGQEPKDEPVKIDQKWLDKWRAEKIDVDRLLADLAVSGIAKISFAYSRDMVADEPGARRTAMAALAALAMAGPNDQEGRGAIRMLERFGALKEERAAAPELFGDIAAKLPVGRRRTAAIGAWVRAWCALTQFDQARAVLAESRAAYGKQAPLLETLTETIRVAEVRTKLELGGEAPPLSGTALNGSAIDTAAWRGEVVVVWFWERTSKACVVRLQELNGLEAQFRGKGVRWLGVAVDQDPKAVAQFVIDSGVPWPQLSEAGRWSAPPVRAWAVASTPRLWVLDRKGVVRGLDLRGRTAVAALLTKLLAEKSD